MVRDAPAIRRCCRCSSRFARAPCWWPTTPGSTSAFLRAAAQRCGMPWPRPPVLYTVQAGPAGAQSRRGPSVRLSALARLVGAAMPATTAPSTTPAPPSTCCTRSSHGWVTRASPPTGSALLPAWRRQYTAAKVLAQRLPPTGGIPLSRPRRRGALHRHHGDLRRRVTQYFTGADPPRPDEGDGGAGHLGGPRRVRPHALEAGVRELRLLAAHGPPYRRSRFPHRWWWIVLTDEPFPGSQWSAAARGACRRPVPVPRGRRRHPRASSPDSPGANLHQARIGMRGVHGPNFARPGRSPCPAASGLTAADYTPAPQQAAALIDGLTTPLWRRRSAGGRTGRADALR